MDMFLIGMFSCAVFGGDISAGALQPSVGMQVVVSRRQMKSWNLRDEGLGSKTTLLDRMSLSVAWFISLVQQSSNVPLRSRWIDSCIRSQCNATDISEYPPPIPGHPHFVFKESSRLMSQSVIAWCNGRIPTLRGRMSFHSVAQEKMASTGYTVSHDLTHSHSCHRHMHGRMLATTLACMYAHKFVLGIVGSDVRFWL